MSTSQPAAPVELNVGAEQWPHFEQLIDIVAASRRLVVLSGAGCSTESGIPDYRDGEGAWKRTPPMQYQEFIGSHAARQRYWARALLGWQQFRHVAPNPAHQVLAQFEHAGRLQHLITQNVDGLHRRAGSRNVVELHGRIDTAVCLQCQHAQSREGVQAQLAERNRHWTQLEAVMAPDGDALLDNVDFATFQLIDCDGCGGMLKPDVVFFGESVPGEVVANAFAAVDAADTLLVVGSSLMVFSGYRFARRARERGIPLAIINQGRTRADGEATVKVAGRCAAVLVALATLLTA